MASTPDGAKVGPKESLASSKVGRKESLLSAASRRHVRTAAHFCVHWFGARRFHNDPALDRHDEASHAQAESHRDLVRTLAKEHFKKKGKSKSIPLAEGEPGSGSTPRPASPASSAPQMSPRSAALEAGAPQPPPEPQQAAQVQEAAQARQPQEAPHRFALEAAEDFMLNAEVSGKNCEEELVRQHWPLFIFFEMLLATTFWLVFHFVKGQDLAGLESILPGQTLFLVHSGACGDHRHELWRWLSYQFTHTSLSHILVNDLTLLIIGPPLEGFDGHWRILAIFNLGVFGGALFQGVMGPHSLGLAGMSGGVYSLLAMHWADIMMNWRQSKFRHLKLILLIILVLIDMCVIFLSPSNEHQDSVVSHYSHLGGFVTGFLISILIVRNLKVKRAERIGQVLAALVLVAVIACCGAWLAQWPPKSIFDSVAWCWARQVNNATVFRDREWHCVPCGDSACVQRWSSQASLAALDPAWCFREGRWT